MIGQLRGILLEKQAPLLMVDVAGVGYELQAPMTTFFALPELDSPVTLHTHLAISESAHQLFGFIRKTDRDFFRLLIKVNGVGPKMAIAIMTMETHDIVRCVTDDNITALVKVPGVGKKTAERLIIEMRDKITSWHTDTSGMTTPAHHNATSDLPAAISKNTHIAEAESALVALGYKPVEATKAVARVLNDDEQSAEELIRLSLKSMMPS